LKSFLAIFYKDTPKTQPQTAYSQPWNNGVGNRQDARLTRYQQYALERAVKDMGLKKSTRLPIKPKSQAMFTTINSSPISIKPRRTKKRLIFPSDQPNLRREEAKRIMPIPMMKKKPGAQGWVKKRVKKAKILEY